jgi:hypothetical protein
MGSGEHSPARGRRAHRHPRLRRAGRQSARRRHGTSQARSTPCGSASRTESDSLRAHVEHAAASAEERRRATRPAGRDGRRRGRSGARGGAGVSGRVAGGPALHARRLLGLSLPRRHLSLLSARGPRGRARTSDPQDSPPSTRPCARARRCTGSSAMSLCRSHRVLGGRHGRPVGGVEGDTRELHLAEDRRSARAGASGCSRPTGTRRSSASTATASAHGQAAHPRDR